MKTSKLEPTVTEGRKLNRSITFNGKTYNLTLHLKLYTYPDFSFETIEKITNENNKEIIGIWRHGRTGGKAHRESLKFDSRTGADFKWFGPTVVYQNGRKKDSYKYLLAIEEI